MNSLFWYTCRQLYPDMPENILNNIRAFVRNQSASSLMQMMQTNHAIDIALQEAEPILNMIDMNNPIIHHSQDSNQTVSNTTHHSDQNTIQNQTLSHTTDGSQNTQTWPDKLLKTLNENHSSDVDSDIEDFEGDFLEEIKHKQYSKAFQIAIKTEKLNVPTFNISNFRIWQPFNLSKINDVEKKQLKKLEPAPAIPMKQLRAQISSFRHIETKTDQPWIYYVGDSSGSGLLLLLVIGGLVYWCCKRPRYDLARPPVSVTYTALESQSMIQTREATNIQLKVKRLLDSRNQWVTDTW